MFSKIEIVNGQYIKIGYFKEIDIYDVMAVFMKYQSDRAPFKVHKQLSGITTGFNVYIRTKQNKKVLVFRSSSRSKSTQFKNELNRMLSKKQSKKKADKNTSSRAYEKWSSEEDELLKQEYKKGKSVKELAELLKRNQGAIRSRLRKLKIF